jgi:hypothetical protein
MNVARSAALVALLVGLLAGLAGCVPWPHHYLTAPHIVGTVSHAGKPVAGARVRLADLMTQTGAAANDANKQEVVTDAQGHFTLGPLRRFSWRSHVPLVSVYEHTAPWGLQLSGADASWQPGWLSDPTLFGEVPKAPLTASCDPAAPSRSSVVKGDKSLVGNGPCQLAISESDK